MQTRKILLIATALAAACAMTACNRNDGNAPAPRTDTSASGTVGGPASTQGGLKGDPAGGTPAGAATASTPEGPPPGGAVNKTDQGGMVSRPTEGRQK